MIQTYARIIAASVKNRLGLIPHPSLCTYFVTWRCNARCVMCDVWKKNRENELSLDEIDSAFTKFKHLDVVRISGGEPFMRDDLIDVFNIIQRRVKPRIVHITTNGLLTDQILSFIKKMQHSENVHFKISLNAPGDKYDEIMGIKGAYGAAKKTLKELSCLRSQYGFYVGVNQTIVDDECLKQYDGLRQICGKYNVDLLPTFAYKKVALYSQNNHTLSMGEGDLTSTFSEFSRKSLLDFFEKAFKDVKNISNFAEKLIKKYYLKGTYNRLILHKHVPNPKCTALRSHIRVLPNGDIPTCLYYPNVVGNLLNDNFTEVWFNAETRKMRKVVDKCSGCWAGCEVIPNAIYTGSIIEALLA